LIEETLGRRLAINHLEFNATPTMLISEIERQINSSQISGSRAPLIFFFPSADGDTPLQAQFRAAFHNQVRFEVVQYPTWPEMLDAGADFGLLINAAVDQILAASSDDILLAGFSFGGFVASEVARRLTELNRRVIFVGLIDTQFGYQSRQQETGLEKVGNLFRKIFTEPSSLEVTVLKFLARHSAFGILQKYGELAQRFPATTAFRSQYRLNYHLRVQAMHRWPLQPVKAPLYLFRTDQFAEASIGPTWGALAKNLEIIAVGGTHLSILRPPAREILCRQLLKTVNSARTAVSPATIAAV